MNQYNLNSTSQKTEPTKTLSILWEHKHIHLTIKSQTEAVTNAYCFQETVGCS